MLITPKNAIELVLTRKTKDFRLRLYETSMQKWLFRLALGSLLVGGLIAAIASIGKNQYVAIAAVTLLLSSEILAAAYQVAAILPELRKLRNVEREASNPLLTEFNDDMDLIGELARDCETHHLQYAKASYLCMARQLRERIAILVGAIDKVGVIPLAITGYFSYAKVQKAGLVTFGGLEWVSVALISLYLLSLRMSSTAQWMEKSAEIYEQAISLRMRK